MPALVGTESIATTLGALARGGGVSPAAVVPRAGAATISGAAASAPASGHAASRPAVVPDAEARLPHGPGEPGTDFLRALEDALAVVLRMQGRDDGALGARGSPAAMASAEAVGFQTVVEVRNRLMSAYHEIMNMSV